MKGFEIRGDWWLPQNPEGKISGKLDFNPNDYPELKLDNTFSSLIDEDPQRLDIICGTSREGKKITLYDCYFWGSEFHYKPDSISRPSKFTIEKVLTGNHFESMPITFKSVIVEFPYLSDWIGKEAIISNKNLDTGVLESVDINLNTFEKKVELNDFNVTLKVEPRYTNRINKEFKIKEFTSIEINSNKEFNLDNYFEVISKTKDLICLLIGKEVSPSTITGFISANVDYMELRPIDVYSPVKNKHIKDGSFSAGRMLLPFGSIEDNFSQIYKKWLEKREKFRWELDFYFGTRYNELMNVENKFLNLVQALESYHRKSDNFNDTYMDCERFDKIKETIFREIPKETPQRVMELIKSRIGYSNNYSLKDRLLDILKENENLLNKFGLDENLIDDIKTTRNHYTHLSKSEKEIMNIKEIGRTVPKLRLVMEICLLNEIGVNKEKIRDRVNYYSKFGDINL